MDEPLRELMTDMEVEARLESGEDALDLSVEKWDRIAAWLRAEMPIAYGDFEAASCGLCQLFSAERCEDCPYRLYFGDICDSNGYHWDIFLVKRDYGSAIAMRDALIEIKENFDHE